MFLAPTHPDRITAPRTLLITKPGPSCSDVMDKLNKAGVIKITQVCTLKEATATLRNREIDVVLAYVDHEHLDVLNLPSKLLDISSSMQGRRIPNIVWAIDCPDLTEQDVVGSTCPANPTSLKVDALKAHAELVRQYGLQATVAEAVDVGSVVQTVIKMASHYAAQPNTGREQDNDPAAHDVLAMLISGKGLRVVYQPQFDLQSGDLLGAEALARWDHPRFGQVSPELLVKTVNDLGLDLLLFSHVEKSVRETLVQLDQAGSQLPIAINACARTLCTAGLTERLERKLQRANLPNDRLKLELTEDLAADDDLALSAGITALRAKGFNVALDDFGTGSASLALLSKIQFDEIKVDKALVKSMKYSSKSIDLIAGIVPICKTLNMKLVIEGIESTAIAEQLKALGCTIGQGYGLGRPMEQHDFIKLACPGRGAVVTIQ